MLKTKKEKTILIVLIVLVILALACYFLFVPKANSGAKTIQVIVNHLDNAQRTFDIKTDAEYLRQALDENNLIEGIEAEYGLWLEAVDGETADSNQQQWWGYTVNGVDAAYGVDGQIVTDGDIYEFTLNVGY